MKRLTLQLRDTKWLGGYFVTIVDVSDSVRY
jgi:hypothetical protein